MCGVVGCTSVVINITRGTRCHVSQHYPPTQLLLGGVVWCSCEMQQQPGCGGAVVAGPWWRYPNTVATFICFFGPDCHTKHQGRSRQEVWVEMPGISSRLFPKLVIILDNRWRKRFTYLIPVKMHFNDINKDSFEKLLVKVRFNVGQSLILLINKIRLLRLQFIYNYKG